MRQRYPRGLWGSAIAAVLFGLGVFAGCAPQKANSSGEIVLVLNTDMSIPKDITAVGIRVEANDKPILDQIYPVGAGIKQVRIPATLGIVAEDDRQDKAVHVRVWALQDTKVRILRDVVTTIPSTRTAMLRVPLHWFCDGKVTDGPDGPVSTCGSDRTCLGGECIPIAVDSDELPEYSPAQVFGGGSSTGQSASCFDTLGCFAKGSAVPIDLKSCTVAAPGNLDRANFGLAFAPGGPGICGADACVVPLNRDEQAGWRVLGTSVVKFPRVVCERMSEGNVLSVVYTEACDTKTASLPTCGPWSSVGADAGTFGDVHVPTDASVADVVDEDSSIVDVSTGDVQDAGDASDVGTDVFDGGSDASADSSDATTPPACDAVGNLGDQTAGLCIRFTYESAGLLPNDPSADGKGIFHARVRSDDIPKLDGSSNTVIGKYDSNPMNPDRIDSLPVLKFNNMPKDGYVFAVFSDAEGSDSDAGPGGGAPDGIPEGPIWAGGMDLTHGMRAPRLVPYHVQPGVGTTITVHLTAGRRVVVPVVIGDVLGGVFNGEGHLAWRAYKQQTSLTSNTPLWGFGDVGDCVSLIPGGPAVHVPGLVFGGPNTQYYFVADLEDATPAPLDDLGDAWSTPGMVVSGEPDGTTGWQAGADDGFSAGDMIDYGDVLASSPVMLRHAIQGTGLKTNTCNSDGGAPGQCPNIGNVCHDPALGACADGHVNCDTTGAPWCVPDTPPGTEVCNGQDDDCDGVPDDIVYANKDCTIAGNEGRCAKGFWQCIASSKQCTPSRLPAPLEIPNNNEDDDCDGLTDSCMLPNVAYPYLSADGECSVVTCKSGWFDLDGRPDDGCEYQCKPTGQEICDGIDNDCSGKIDDMTQSEVDSYCAGQNTSATNVQSWACVRGQCVITLCLPNYSERDGMVADGCEADVVSCSNQQPAPEQCNGVDDNCDGQVDNGVAGSGAPCWGPLRMDSQGACSEPNVTGISWDAPPGATCNGLGNLATSCQVGQLQCRGGMWVCEGFTEPWVESCDGRDNDCDGSTDEYDGPVGESCGGLSDGTWSCDSGNTHKFACQGATPVSYEVCDGRDNDGNGTTDDVPDFGKTCGSSLGVCLPGTIQCVFENNQWSLKCVGGREPEPEIIGNGLDDDCDGQIDESN